MTNGVTGSAIASGPRTRPHRLQGRIEGPSLRLDRRVHAIRDDLADVFLAGSVIAPRYVEGVARQGILPTATMHARPDAASTVISQLLLGEAFTLFDTAGDWGWGQCGHDGYVGWTRLAALGEPLAASHRVAAATAAVFAAPDIKAPLIATVPLNALLAASDAGERFVAAAGGFVHRRHVAGLTDAAADPVAVALGFVGSPYVWGGRTRQGIDCSGLTQAALLACGIACPRDSDQQAAAFPAIGAAARRAGDLVVFPGHVGILVDPDTILHANAHWMATVVEPLADAARRLAPAGFHRPAARARSC
ncbi:MAG: C40 family peptidase [Sphingomonadaceae bacterium]|nr:C40 family peptidase [Sphingomonadaceae bacterium]